MGMMSGCYFVGRAELLEWINELLGINYDKVEDVANGAAFCQVIDAIHPGSVALARVNFNAITEAEMVENYKILQDAFSKNGITQYLDVATLCKGKYMAALELFQWIHGYYEQLGGPGGYDGPGRRRQCKCRDPTGRGRPGNKPAGMAKRRGGIPMNTPPAQDRPRAPPASKQPAQPQQPAKPKPVRADGDAKPKPKPSKPSPPPIGDPPGAAAGDTKQLRKEIAALRQELQQREQERDFYYGKLRRIEDYCQENEEQPVMQQVLDILYETDEEHGFIAPEDDDDP
jgi:RP/EB family microtubule-associated protein